MMNLQIGGDTLGTESAFVNREIVSRFKPNNVIVLNQQIHPTLYCAVGAVRRYDFVYNPVRAPAVEWRIMQMRAESFHNLFEMLYLTHNLISRG